MTTETVHPSSLRLHPFLEKVPNEYDPELIISMTIDIEARGIDQPLIIDERGRVMDGRLRLKIAAAEAIESVPVIRASSKDAATIIVQSLLQRRHYSKSALAYLAYPFFEQMANEARDRMVSRRYGSTQNVLPAAPGTTIEQIAHAMRISRALFFQAAALHKAFAKNAAAREQFEPKILSGELNLGYAINGVAGQAATAGQARGAVHQLELFNNSISKLRIRFSKWEMIPAKNRTFIANEFAQAIADAPEEIQERVLATLKVRKASHKGH